MSECEKAFQDLEPIKGRGKFVPIPSNVNHNHFGNDGPTHEESKEQTRSGKEASTMGN